MNWRTRWTINAADRASAMLSYLWGRRSCPPATPSHQAKALKRHPTRLKPAFAAEV